MSGSIKFVETLMGGIGAANAVNDIIKTFSDKLDAENDSFVIMVNYSLVNPVYFTVDELGKNHWDAITSYVATSTIDKRTDLMDVSRGACFADDNDHNYHVAFEGLRINIVRKEDGNNRFIFACRDKVVNKYYKEKLDATRSQSKKITNGKVSIAFSWANGGHTYQFECVDGVIPDSIDLTKI